MLKIYIQIFGTIALVAILLINYNFFYRSPAMDAIAEQGKKLKKANDSTAVMDGIITYEPKIAPVMKVIDRDREDLANLDLPTSFSEPDMEKVIYDLVLKCDLDSRGIMVQRVQAAAPKVAVTDFVATPKEQDAFKASIESFQNTMKALEGPRMEEFRNSTNAADRVAFYQAMSQGKPTKVKLSLGFERHQYKLTLTGTYTNVKRFLYLVSINKPLIQATSVRIVPKTGLGETRPFTLDVTLVTYVDRNTVYEQMNGDPGALLAASAKSADKEKKAAAAKAAASTATPTGSVGKTP